MVVGRQTLHFFPDRVLIYDEKSVGAVSYRELQLNRPGFPRHLFALK